MREETLRNLAAHFLAELSDRYGTDGCNDFDLDEFVPDLDERRALMFEAEKANGTPQDFHPNEDYRCVPNFVICDLVARLIRDGKP